MLTAAFADALGVSEDEARAMLLDFARRVREQTQIGPVDITGLGTFEQRDGSLAFSPDDSLALIVNHVYADLRPLPMHGALPPQTAPEPAPDQEPELDPEPEPQSSVPTEAPTELPAPMPTPAPPAATLPETPAPESSASEPDPLDEFGEEVTGPLGELPMPPLFATDDTLSALRDASRDLDPHAHKWADDLIREERDDVEPSGEPQPVSDESPFSFVDDEPEPFGPDGLDSFDDEPFDDEPPTFAPTFDSPPEPTMSPASEPPEIALPEPDVPEPVYAEPEYLTPVEPEPFAEPSPVAEQQPAGEPEPISFEPALTDDDLIARIAPSPDKVLPPAPPATPLPAATPPPSEPQTQPLRAAPRRKRSGLPMIGLLVLALLLGVAAMMWWLTRPSVPDSTIAAIPADTTQMVSPVDTVATPPAEPETALRGSTPVSVPPGYTVVVGGGTAAEAEAIAQPYRDRGYRTGILVGTSRGSRIYRVGVGQFETRREADAARTGALRQGELGELTPSDAFLFPFQ